MQRISMRKKINNLIKTPNMRKRERKKWTE